MSHLRRRSGQIEIRPFTYLRILGWMWLVLAASCIAAGCALLVQLNAHGVIFLVLGAVGCVVARLGWTCVRCNADGVTYRLIRTRFFPRDTIATVGIKPVAGTGASRAEVELCLNDGRRVPLDATLIVRSGPGHTELKAQIAEMRALLGLPPTAAT